MIPHRCTSPAWRRLASEFEMGSGAGDCSVVLSVCHHHSARSYTYYSNFLFPIPIPVFPRIFILFHAFFCSPLNKLALSCYLYSFSPFPISRLIRPPNLHPFRCNPIHYNPNQCCAHMAYLCICTPPTQYTTPQYFPPTI